MQQVHDLLVMCLLGTLSDSFMNGTECPAQRHRRGMTHNCPQPMIEQQSKPSLTLFWRPKEGEDSEMTFMILYDANTMSWSHIRIALLATNNPIGIISDTHSTGLTTV